MIIHLRLPLAAAALTAVAVPAAAQTAAQPLIDRCTAQTCIAQLTPEQLLAEAEKLVLAGRTHEARPMIAALSRLSSMRLETRFLTALADSHEGDHRSAANIYKAILADDPRQTRVRLELASEMLVLGKRQSAERQFRIAAQDKDLPADIARTIRAVRDVIRQKRHWHLDLDFGIAPDTNINSATNADQINILWGTGTLPLTLDKAAKATSGLGETGSISAGLRLPANAKVAGIIDLDAVGTNYAGTAYDDYTAQIAAGTEIKLSPATITSVEGVAAERWYGGHPITRQLGVKGGFQSVLSPRQRIGVQVDVRHTRALFDRGYDGWQLAASATYEHAFAKTLVASAGPFVRHDALRSKSYSNYEIGGIVGLGGELPLGINFGVSATLSHATYDQPMYLFSLQPRKDWRYSVRATLGNRKIRVLGFSPEVSATYQRNASNLPYYSISRARFQFSLARYF